MATQDDVKKLERGLKAAYEKGEIEKAKAIGTELVRLQKQQKADLAKLDESIERLPKAPRPSALDLAKDLPISFAKGSVLGSAEVAGLPGLVQSGVSAMTGQDISQAPPSMMAAPLPQYKDIMNLIEKMPGAKRLTQYQPKTDLGEFFEMTGRFVGPTLPFTKPLQEGRGERIARAFGIGTAAAAPAYAFEDSPAISIPSSLVAGGLTAFATAPRAATDTKRQSAADERCPCGEGHGDV